MFQHQIFHSLLAALASLILLTPVAWSQGGNRPTLVKVDAVSQAPLVQTVEVIGALVSRRSGIVAAQVAGPVIAMRVDTGDAVKKGTVIAEINIDSMRARRALAKSRLDQARIGINTREAEVKLARQSRERFEKLTRNQTITRAAYDDALQNEAIAIARVSEAKANVLAAEADLKVAEVDLKRNEVKAPYSGIVTNRLTEIGSYVRLGDPVVELVGDGKLEIEVAVPFDRLGGVRAGVDVDWRLDDGSEHKATVRAVLPVEDTRTRTRAVRLSPKLSDDERRLAVGQTAVVRIPQGVPRDILSVHKDAVIRRGDKALVYVVEGDTASMRPVKLGDAVGARFEILSGLAAGEQVVVRGNERLRPGAKVTTGGKPGGKPEGAGGANGKAPPKPDATGGKKPTGS